MSSVLQVLLVAAGLFTIALGVAHLWVPRIFAFDRAIGVDGGADSGLGSIDVGRWRYVRRRADALGLAWVMSNAASYVLITIGVIDLAWAVGDRRLPLGLGAIWIAGWWSIRAGSQAVLGGRRVDLAVAAWFATLAVVHVAVGAAA